MINQVNVYHDRIIWIAANDNTPQPKLSIAAQFALAFSGGLR